MSLSLTAYHGTHPDEPLVGGKNPVSRHTLQALWASNSYFLAAQFQDGEVRKLTITLENPLIIDCGGQSVYHAKIVADTMAQNAGYDGVIFIDTIDGMECGDVVAVFGRPTPSGISVDHAVTVIGRRHYDDTLEDWVSLSGFDADVDSLPQHSSWTFHLTPVS